MKLSLTLGAILAASLTSSAFAVVPVTPLTYGNFDTRSAGSYSPSAFSQDGDGSLQMTTTDGTSNGKVSVYFAGPGSTLGALSAVTSIGFQDYRATLGTDPTLNPASTVAFRLHLSDGNALIWENNYQAGNPVVTPDTWINESIVNGNFWEHDATGNHNDASGAIPLSQWLSGSNPDGSAGIASTANIDYIEISFGSGVSAYNGFIDNPSLTFSTGESYLGNVTAATPEPASLSVMGVGAVALLARRRKAAK